MTVMSAFTGAFTRLDQRAGDQLETVLRRHHRRRLGRLGWSDAIEPDDGPSWWSTRTPIRQGNLLEVLIDGSSALTEFDKAIRSATRSVHIAGWHSSPDFELTRGPGAESLRDLLAEVAERVPVRLLLWAGPPLPAFQPTRRVVREARAEFIRESKVQCALDKRERTMHCHHEKIIVIDDTTAFVGGIDLTALQGDRDDSTEHRPREPLGWHDCAARLRGPAVVDVAAHFNARWHDVTGESLPEPPTPPDAGSSEVQVLRTVPEKTYGFAPRGAFTILEAYARALRRAEHFIYLENQFLWSPEIADVLVDKLRNPPRDEFRILLLLPAKPSNGADTTRGQLGRLLDADADAGRLLATTISGHAGGQSVQVYVHAKVAVIDDRWLTLGSANLNEHSLLNDTEMNVLTCDPALARDTRLRLWSEHTERPAHTLQDEPWRVIDEVWRPTAQAQARLDATHQPRTHRLSLLAAVSRRTDRLQGPMSGLLVDG
jgi:phosphatidylserine/phosphatidylglycerophosphate/cardiolipin synthase-like enzyme